MLPTMTHERKCGKRVHRLQQLFVPAHPQFVEHQCQQNRRRKAQQQLDSVDPQRDAYRAEKRGIAEQRFKVRQPIPGTGQDAQPGLEALERQCQSAHGHVANNDVPRDRRQSEQIDLAIF